MKHPFLLQYRPWILACISLTCIMGVLFLPAIPQFPGYHGLADDRTLWGIPNMLNIITNLPFTLVGIAGIRLLAKASALNVIIELKPCYYWFFAGIAGVGLGSIYYHNDPSNDTLVWDRLPMSLAFMSFFCIILGEYVSIKMAKSLSYPLLLIGAGSVLYWWLGEKQGQGDLRIYGLVQYLPLVLMPIILLIYPAKFSHANRYWIFYGLYGLAKIFEIGDLTIYQLSGFISGHSLKHLAAAAGCAVFLRQLMIRKAR
ncbi:MAG: ceramidase domain-containing protein [Methylomicrobium sp.]|nr:ceramidase domain-containing protein [Methylomicrobium sp.]